MGYFLDPTCRASLDQTVQNTSSCTELETAKMAAVATEGVKDLKSTSSLYSWKANIAPLTKSQVSDSANGAAAKTSTNGTPAENGGAEDDSEDDDAEDGVAANGAGESGAAKKKKKKPKKKKKKTPASGTKGQSSPPRVKIADLFPDGNFPVGEEVEYKDENAYRTTSEEKRHLERLDNDKTSDLRQCAEVHRQVRKWAQRTIKPGMGLTEIAEGIEDSVRHLTGHMGLEEGDNIKGGVAFPTGLSRNNCAAHYSPNAGNTMVLDEADVMKVDFGVHLNGHIIDSAFTMSFKPEYDNLLAAVKDATNTGVRVCLSYIIY